NFYRNDTTRFVHEHRSTIFIPDLKNSNDERYPPKVTPKKRALNNSYSQDKEISNSPNTIK
ncbi:3013_t:CDS:2, partial [Cetraspora pellucida]